MNKKHLLVLGLLSLIPFLVYAFGIETLIGADSFYFFALSCGQENIPEIGIPILSRILFELMPCSLFAFKALFFVVLFVSTIIISKTGELFDKEHGWLAGVFVFISIAWVHGFVGIEDDILGYPVLFLANYFFLKAGIEKSNRGKVLAVALVILTGTLLWKGALLYLVVYTFFSTFSLVILYASLFYIGFGSMNALLGNDLVQENANAFLLSLLGSRTLGFGHGIGLLGMYVLTRRLWLVVPFLVAMLLNAKWAIHLSPFLGLGLMFLVVDLDKMRIQRGIVFKESWANKHFIKIFIVLAFVSTAALSVGLLFQNPNPNQIEAVEFTVQQADGRLIDNDWSYGYYLMFFGGQTKTFGGGWPRYTESCNDRILLTENPAPYEGCSLLKEWSNAGFYGNDIKVYECFTCIGQDDVGGAK